jgi:hypothetical protein
MATATIPPIVRLSGKGRQSALVERLRDAEDEITALHAERASLAAEVEALSRRIVFAITAGHPNVALHVAGRLDALAHSLRRRGAA